MTYFKAVFRSTVQFAAPFVIILAAFGGARGQTVVDKTVATVSDGVRTEVILYSEILWQLALQPKSSLTTPSREDLNSALDSLINQQLFALEALRLPRTKPTDEEIQAEIKAILSRFPSTAVFEERLRSVGFSSVRDDDFVDLITKRVAINNFIDFRFRSFVIVSADEVQKYYNETYVPDFRRRQPGVVIPTLESKRAAIHNLLVEDKVAARIESFLDDRKRQAEIVILSEP
ncbi:MAG TPA: hypothetical protein PKC65_06970 [Pyrinomonadaceae bacterium]|nr:hypothetical protein [Pyrinomonadaceae bacterium]